MAKRLGITSINPEKVQGGIAIGTQEVSPLDMASAYSVFAGRGIRAEPTPVLRIEDYDGNVIVDNTLGNRGERVLEEPVADNMNQMLRTVVEAGTGTAAKLGRPVAGKTGTSQNYENAWFVGYTPTLSTAVWMGYPKGNIPMRGVRGVGQVTGGSHPARMWKAFMTTALRNVEATDFTEPAPIESLADRAKREQRGGFDLGKNRGTIGLPSDGTYYQPPPVPQADAPTTTTTAPVSVAAGEGDTTATTAPAAPTASSTTTTTRPGLPSPRRTTTTTAPDDEGENGGF
jgi:penicillin-binding protein 1A